MGSVVQRIRSAVIARENTRLPYWSARRAARLERKKRHAAARKNARERRAMQREYLARLGAQ